MHLFLRLSFGVAGSIRWLVAPPFYYSPPTNQTIGSNNRPGQLPKTFFESVLTTAIVFDSGNYTLPPPQLYNGQMAGIVTDTPAAVFVAGMPVLLSVYRLF
jgi:hypothetical protein